MQANLLLSSKECLNKLQHNTQILNSSTYLPSFIHLVNSNALQDLNTVASQTRKQPTVQYSKQYGAKVHRGSEGNWNLHVGLDLLGLVSGIHGRCGGFDAVTVKKKRTVC
jgi:hypothetical protein